MIQMLWGGVLLLSFVLIWWWCDGYSQDSGARGPHDVRIYQDFGSFHLSGNNVSVHICINFYICKKSYTCLLESVGMSCCFIPLNFCMSVYSCIIFVKAPGNLHILLWNWLPWWIQDLAKRSTSWHYPHSWRSF